MKGRAIICIILLLMAYAICGCENKKDELAYLEWDCICGEELFATYIKPYYWFECIKCGAIKTNTECGTVEEFYKLVGFENGPKDLPNMFGPLRTTMKRDPNEASYKAWFGWE